MVGFLYRVPVYLSPFFMSGMEMQLNELAKNSAPSAVLAPSMAAASIGLFLPALRPSDSLTAGWKRTTDRIVTAVSILGLLFAFYAWQMLVATNLGNGTPAWMPKWDLLGLGRHATFAILVYAVAAFLAEFKAQVEK